MSKCTWITIAALFIFGIARVHPLHRGTESGQKTPYTEWRLKLGSMLRGKRDEHRVRFRKPKPGEELNDSFDLKDLYLLTTGVSYLITARRTIYKADGKGEGEIASNTVKLKVTPCQPRAFDMQRRSSISHVVLENWWRLA